MLAVSLVQITCSVGSVYLGAKVAMAAGRDLRGAVLHQVGHVLGAGGRAVRGAVADHPQHQRRAAGADADRDERVILVMAPIMCVGGIFMAVREDLQLSWILVVAVPALALSMGLIIARMVPGFRLMQTRIDAVNRVLREQITGIRVVRAFVRERQEIWRFGIANTELTETALRVGRLMALMFPAVMLISNITSVAVIWFGGHEIDAGTMQIGSLTAMLSYIMQILMVGDDGVVPGDDGAARGGVRRPDRRGARHRILGRAADPIPSRSVPTLVSSSFRRRVLVPRRRGAGAARHQLPRRTRARPPRSSARTGSGKTTLLNLIPRLDRRHRRRGVRRGDRRARHRPRTAALADRARAAEAVPVLRHHRHQPALRQPRRHRRGTVAMPRDRAGRRLRPGHARGWTPRSRRAAPPSPAVSGSGSRSRGRW